MKKSIVAVLAAALFALALPTAAIAWDSPSGAVRDTVTVQTPAGIQVKVAVAANGTGSISVGQTSQAASNAPATAPEGYIAIGSFKITKTGDVTAPYNFAYNLGSEYANADVTVYIDHEGEADNEVVQKTASSDGTVTFTTDTLSIHTVYAKKSANAGAVTDKGSKSPQTGLNTGVVAGATIAAAAGAAICAIALRSKVRA